MAAKTDSRIPTSVCAIDLGTYSAILLVAQVRRGVLRPIREVRRTVDLARTPGSSITRAALSRTARIIRDFDRMAQSYRVANGLVVATAAVRNARNRSEVLRTLKSSISFGIRVMTPRQEAELTAAGALVGLKKRHIDPLVVDIGGGSTEFIRPLSGVFAGVPVGAALATRRWKSCMPQRRAARDLYLTLCAERAFKHVDPARFGSIETVIAVGGTAATLAAIKSGAQSFDIDRVHGTTISYEWMAAFAAMLSQMSLRQISRLVPYDPSRARVLCAGTYLWCGVLNRLNIDRVTVSARGLRWGLAARLAGIPQRIPT